MHGAARERLRREDGKCSRDTEKNIIVNFVLTPKLSYWGYQFRPSWDLASGKPGLTSQLLRR